MVTSYNPPLISSKNIKRLNARLAPGYIYISDTETQKFARVCLSDLPVLLDCGDLAGRMIGFIDIDKVPTDTGYSS